MLKISITEDTIVLRQSLVDNLVAKGSIISAKVEEAFRQVPRHIFVEGFATSQEAYQNETIGLKSNLSSSSQPEVMAKMLEELDLEGGMKVLEIGTASGYNAALLAEIVGVNNVYTIELEDDLANRAREKLKLDYQQVTIITSDGYYGYQKAAPYDRIIITAEAEAISKFLVEQLKMGSKLLTPYNFYDTVTLLVRLEKGKETTGEIIGYPVQFVPFRGDNKVNSKQKEELIINLYHKVYNLALSYNVNFDDKLILLLMVIKKCQESDFSSNLNEEVDNIYQEWKAKLKSNYRFKVKLQDEKLVVE